MRKTGAGLGGPVDGCVVNAATTGPTRDPAMAAIALTVWVPA